MSEYCVVGKAERTIQGFPIERDCWEKQIIYACPNVKPGGACTPLVDDPDCTQTGSECLTRDTDGVCLTEIDTFRCSAQKRGGGISLEGFTDTAPVKDVASSLQCGSNLYCPGGICEDLSQSEASTDFGKAASWMGMLTQMGIEKDPDAVTLFRGDGQKCSRWPLGTKNCCSEDGILLGVLGCSEEEEILAEKRAARLTHFVGSYCSKDSFLGCITKKKSFCTFRSLFSRVLQEQARAQLGIGWGSAEDPDCRSLSIEEIQRIDFSQIDLSELYADMVEDANVSDPATVKNQIKSKIDDYYRKSP